MYVVIHSDCDAVPENAKPLNSQGDGLLNFLLVLGYHPMQPPLADLLRRYYHLEGEWLILTPVHWEATHNDAMIIAQGKDLKLQDSEAKSWFYLFSKYFEEEDRVLHYHNAETWLISNDKKHVLNAKPVHHVLNRSLMPELAQMDDSMYCQKLITESQMLFASKPNQSLMNGLWIWGGAKLKDKMKIKVCVDEEFLLMAQMCSSDVTLYHPKIKIKEYQILLITEFSQLSGLHQEELKKIPAHWYWNNTAYLMPAAGWLTCLWRKLIHAY